jgi:thiol-disulfide isomerase/thioredoxin
MPPSKTSTRRPARGRTPKSSGPNRGLLFGAIAAVVVVIAAVAAILITGGDDDSPESQPGVEETRPVTITGQALPTYDGAVSPDPAVGMTLPGISGQNFAGDAVAITDDGKAKVVVYAAHWCPHCQKEIPLLAADLAANPLPANVDMYVVSAAGNSTYPNYPPSAWLAGVNWPTPVIADDTSASAGTALGVSEYPYFVFVDANNKVVNRVTGEIPVEDFRARVDAIANT